MSVTMSIEQRIRRLADVREIEKIMARHVYYHARGHHREELLDLWSKHTPDQAWVSSVGRWSTLESMFDSYVNCQEYNWGNKYPRLVELDPNAEGLDPRGLGTVSLHTLTTPLIEVARDGKTAKGIWYTPGFGINQLDVMESGKSADWMWERYAVDFVKEPEGWRIWHLFVGVDNFFSSVDSKSWVDMINDHMEQERKMKERQASGEPMPERPKSRLTPPDDPSVNYMNYNFMQTPQAVPRMPEPYDTFDDTFSY